MEYMSTMDYKHVYLEISVVAIQIMPKMEFVCESCMWKLWTQKVDIPIRPLVTYIPFTTLAPKVSDFLS
jgi:hypothetical protein